jgi:LysR family glycine cleavage system transcriptional activator
MPRNLPPLNSLRVFEAVARHGSLTKAATELHVTQSAISRQLATIEEYLGVALFNREPRGVSLTKVGATYHQTIGPAFAAITTATERIAGRAEDEPLRLCAYDTFAAKWLIQRLHDFELRHPAIPIEITTRVLPIDFSEVEVDAAIQVGNGDWPGVDAYRLFDDVIEPVCSPALARGGPPLDAIDNLAHYPLLQTRYRRHDWVDWLQGVGRGDLKSLIRHQHRGTRARCWPTRPPPRGAASSSGKSTCWPATWPRAF